MRDKRTPTDVCGEATGDVNIGEYSHLDFASVFTVITVYDICRLQTADCRLQITDCKSNDTKKLPNKGDVIKNMTSCESEKVAWEQG